MKAFWDHQAGLVQTATYRNTPQHATQLPEARRAHKKKKCNNTLQHTATHCNTMRHTATHGNTQQHTAIRCNTLQHTAKHCNTQQHTATHGNTPQHTATHCNTLQHTATHCNTLPTNLRHDAHASNPSTTFSATNLKIDPCTRTNIS